MSAAAGAAAVSSGTPLRSKRTEHKFSSAMRPATTHWSTRVERTLIMPSLLSLRGRALLLHHAQWNVERRRRNTRDPHSSTPLLLLERARKHILLRAPRPTGADGPAHSTFILRIAACLRLRSWSLFSSERRRRRTWRENGRFTATIPGRLAGREIRLL